MGVQLPPLGLTDALLLVPLRGMDPMVAALNDRQVRGRILDALEQAYKKGGFGAMMTRAYEIEAGVGPFKPIDDRRKWLSDLLRDIASKGQVLDTKVEMTPNEKARLHMYRDDLRRVASAPDPLVSKVASRWAKFKETKETKVERVKKIIRDATGLSGGKSEQIADAIVRGREVERLAIQKGWPIEDGVIHGDGGSIALSDIAA